MPGPKMGARPADFDEEIVKQAPTFQKWLKLEYGQTLRYACRDFVKGHGDDEERLMRRIMIARRNNLRDHEILKKARSIDPERAEAGSPKRDCSAESGLVPEKKSRKRKIMSTNSLNTEDIDMPAVEATRSYKAWLALEQGREFTYNQKYIKGKEGHEELLKKNIWRRMRYRRENKKMIERMKAVSGALSLVPKTVSVKLEEIESSDISSSQHAHETIPEIVAVKLEDIESSNFTGADIQETVQSGGECDAEVSDVDHTPLDTSAIEFNGSALDAAAKLAAASTSVDDNQAIEKSLAVAVAAAAAAQVDNADDCESIEASKIASSVEDHDKDETKYKTVMV